MHILPLYCIWYEWKEVRREQIKHTGSKGKYLGSKKALIKFGIVGCQNFKMGGCESRASIKVSFWIFDTALVQMFKHLTKMSYDKRPKYPNKIYIEGDLALQCYSMGGCHFS